MKLWFNRLQSHFFVLEFEEQLKRERGESSKKKKEEKRSKAETKPQVQERKNQGNRPKNGFDHGRKAIAIDGATDEPGELCLVVKFEVG